jgi:hypothetical protein
MATRHLFYYYGYKWYRFASAYLLIGRFPCTTSPLAKVGRGKQLLNFLVLTKYQHTCILSRSEFLSILHFVLWKLERGEDAVDVIFTFALD